MILKAELSQVGEIVDINYLTDTKTKLPLESGFIECKTSADAKRILERYQKLVCYVNIRISFTFSFFYIDY